MLTALESPPAPPPQTQGQLFAPASAAGPAKVCVIAEIGVNHDGRLDLALELVDAAADAGADAVKLQLFEPRFLLSNQALLAEYQKASSPRNDDVFAMLARLKLDLDDMLAVRAAARRAGLLFAVTPFSLENFDALRALDPDIVKIASPDAVNHPLLTLAASLGRPMVVSTGTAALDELAFAASLLKTPPGTPERGGCFLQCVSSYPASCHDAALGAMAALARRFGLPVGYSDHTTGLMTGALAVAAGACVIEKHLTYDRQASGPDHAASFDARAFKQYVTYLRQATAMLGPLAKTVRDVEVDVRCVARQSVCAMRDLPAGHVLSGEDLTVKRPGTGIPAARLGEIVGRRLACAVRGNNLLRESDLT